MGLPNIPTANSTHNKIKTRTTMISANVSFIPLNFVLIRLIKEIHEKIKTPIIIKSSKLELKSLIHILDKKGIVSKMSV